MPESQEKIYYVCADSVEHAAKMPQAERVLKAGYEVLYLTVDEDEIVLQMLENAGGKPFVSVADENALPETDEEKAALEQAEKDHKDVLDFAQETLKDQVAKVRLSKILQSGSVCLTTEGPVSLEMEKYFRKMRRDFPMQAQKVLEINPDSSAFQALCNAFQAGDKEKAAAYVEILYNQALIIADFPLPDPRPVRRAGVRPDAVSKIEKQTAAPAQKRQGGCLLGRPVCGRSGCGSGGSVSPGCIHSPGPCSPGARRRPGFQ